MLVSPLSFATIFAELPIETPNTLTPKKPVKVALPPHMIAPRRHAPYPPRPLPSREPRSSPSSPASSTSFSATSNVLDLQTILAMASGAPAPAFLSSLSGEPTPGQPSSSPAPSPVAAKKKRWAGRPSKHPKTARKSGSSTEPSEVLDLAAILKVAGY
jgi:hypothetical protein